MTRTRTRRMWMMRTTTLLSSSLSSPLCSSPSLEPSGVAPSGGPRSGASPSGFQVLFSHLCFPHCTLIVSPINVDQKKRSQFECVARHFALVSDNDGITILGFASRPLLNACASLLLHQQWWGDAGTRRSELHK